MLVRDYISSDLRCLFPFDRFNAMQMQVLEQAYRSDQNMVVSAPTGSGKTVVHELALARLIMQCRGNKTFRCVYIAPSKALCQQRWTEWKIKLEPLKLQVLEVTGDVEWKEVLKIIASAAIIVTTPEKWDSLTRMWRDNVFLLGLVDLLLLDEIHHLGEERGAVLETVIVRMRIINNHCCSQMNSESQRRMRIVALSATLPNIKDVGVWLGCDQNAIHYFDDRYRPVPLQVLCFGYECKGNQYLFEKGLDKYLKDLILRYDVNRQTIVFCASKKGTQSCAQFLSTNLSFSQHHRSDSDPVITYSCSQLQDQELAKLFPHGVAYHHAGLPPDDRIIVEQLFLQGKIRVLCSTSTLSQGMNLPAHLVIVKGTVAWRGSSKGYVKLRKSDVIQMLGRAGRPGFDDEGIAIIMTSVADQQYFSSISLHADVVNSNLHLIFHEALVAEISQRVITTRDSCMEWIKSTFFYNRLLSNPPAEIIGHQSVDVYAREILARAVKDLEEATLIIIDKDEYISPPAEAHIMSKALIKFKSMKILMQIPSSTTIQQLLHYVSLCEELHKPVKRTEKKVLNDLMKHIRFPIRDRVQEPKHKCFVLMQAAVTLLPDLKDFTLRIEQAEIVENATRLLHGLRDLSIHKKSGLLLESCLLLERALKTRLWETSNISPFLQCANISEKTKQNLQSSAVFAVTDVYGSTLAQVKSRVSCSDEEARTLIQFAASVHCCKLAASYHISNEGKIKVVVSLVEKDKRVIAIQAMSFNLVCYDVTSSRLLLYRYLAAGYEGGEIDLAEKIKADSVRIRIIGSLVGADNTFGAAIPLPTQPETQRKVRTTNNAIGVQQKVDKAENLLSLTPQIADYSDLKREQNRQLVNSQVVDKSNPFDQFKYSDDSKKEKENNDFLKSLSRGVNRALQPPPPLPATAQSLSTIESHARNSTGILNHSLAELQRMAAHTRVPSINVSRLKPEILRKSYMFNDVTGSKVSDSSSLTGPSFTKKQSNKQEPKELNKQEPAHYQESITFEDHLTLSQANSKPKHTFFDLQSDDESDNYKAMSTKLNENLPRSNEDTQEGKRYAPQPLYEDKKPKLFSTTITKQPSVITPLKSELHSKRQLVEAHQNQSNPLKKFRPEKSVTVARPPPSLTMLSSKMLKDFSAAFC